MAGTGPAANPNARRRNARVGPLVLPAHGPAGRAPKWPLPDNPRLQAQIEMLEETISELEEREIDEGKLSRTDQTKLTRTRERIAIRRKELEVIQATEKELWRDLWKTPQANEWKRLQWTREVAQYVRWKAQAEVGDLDAGKEARQLADRIGLTPKSMRALMWTIAVDEVAELRQEKRQQAATGTEGRRSRGKFFAVPDED